MGSCLCSGAVRESVGYLHSRLGCPPIRAGPSPRNLQLELNPEVPSTPTYTPLLQPPRPQSTPPPTLHSLSPQMSAIISRRALNAAPTARTAASGVPAARGLNLAAAAPHDAHAHGHGPTTRTDFATLPKWAKRTEVAQGGLLQRARMNGEWSARRAGGLGRKRWAVIGPRGGRPLSDTASASVLNDRGRLVWENLVQVGRV